MNDPDLSKIEEFQEEVQKLIEKYSKMESLQDLSFVLSVIGRGSLLISCNSEEEFNLLIEKSDEQSMKMYTDFVEKIMSRYGKDKSSRMDRSRN